MKVKKKKKSKRSEGVKIKSKVVLVNWGHRVITISERVRFWDVFLMITKQIPCR